MRACACERACKRVCVCTCTRAPPHPARTRGPAAGHASKTVRAMARTLQPARSHACDPRTHTHARTRALAGKLAGLDKKLSKSLDQEVQSTGSSPLAMAASPMGPLAESSRCVRTREGEGDRQAGAGLVACMVPGRQASG